MTDADGRYERIRKRLHERGYLERPVERFVLRDVAGPMGGVARFAGAALRAAVLGAFPLGGLLAAAALLANRPLLGLRDVWALWAYFAVASALVLFLADLTAATLAAAIAARRGAQRSDAHRAALLVGLPTLAYLVLLWDWRYGSRPLWTDLLFLAAAVPVALLVARLAGIVSLSAVVGRTGDVPDRPVRPALTLGAVLVPAALVLLAIAAWTTPRPASAAPPEFVVAGDAPRLLLVGIDGLGAELLSALGERGGAPRLRTASPRWKLVHPPDAEPPEVWTTLMTGVPPEVHGVRSAGADQLPGLSAPLQRGAGPVSLEMALRFLLPSREVPTGGAFRSVRSIWEILGLRLKTVAVGWWATWPAQDDGGYTVTDRTLPRLVAGRDADRDTAPGSLYARLARDFPGVRARIRIEFGEWFGTFEDAELERWLWDSWLIDAWSWQTASDLARDPEVAAVFIYLPGLDILRTRLGARPANQARMLGAQGAVARYVESLDSRLADGSPPGRWVSIVIGDPGRMAGPGADGFVLLDGLAGAGCDEAALDPLDVAPTVLRIAGFPLSAEMPGRPPKGCGFLGTALPRVAGFGRRPAPTGPLRSADDPELIERLRSLGYVQ